MSLEFEKENETANMAPSKMESVVWDDNITPSDDNHTSNEQGTMKHGDVLQGSTLKL